MSNDNNYPATEDELRELAEEYVRSYPEEAMMMADTQKPKRRVGIIETICLADPEEEWGDPMERLSQYFGETVTGDASELLRMQVWDSIVVSAGPEKFRLTVVEGGDKVKNFVVTPGDAESLQVTDAAVSALTSGFEVDPDDPLKDLLCKVEKRSQEVRSLSQIVDLLRSPVLFLERIGMNYPISESDLPDFYSEAAIRTEFERLGIDSEETNALFENVPEQHCQEIVAKSVAKSAMEHRYFMVSDVVAGTRRYTPMDQDLADLLQRFSGLKDPKYLSDLSLDFDFPSERFEDHLLAAAESYNLQMDGAVTDYISKNRHWILAEEEVCEHSLQLNVSNEALAVFEEHGIEITSDESKIFSKKHTVTFEATELEAEALKADLEKFIVKPRRSR